MADPIDMDVTNEAGKPVRSRSKLAPALAAVAALAVAGGWAYDNRAEYGAAYGDLFGQVSEGCTSGGCPLTAIAAESPCCHAESGCCAPEVLTALAPVEAPKPPIVLSEVEAAPPTLDAAL